jgi:hypothetical protein
MSTLEDAEALLARSDKMTQAALSEAFKALPEEAQSLYRKMEKAKKFAPERENKDSIKEYLSPSGKYKLVTSLFTTGLGMWDYSQGKVFRVGSDEPIAVIQRNYGVFPFLWIEDHPNGHPYLLAGEDYQGQTVVELDTGKVVNNLSHGASQGFGFCWSSYTFNREHQLLVVEGCCWACPYEFRFFDFSDPIGKGWPELECECGAPDADAKQPVFNADGTITCFESEYIESDEDEDEGNQKEAPVRVRKVFRREGMSLKLVEGWVSEEEQERRRKNEEYERQQAEWVRQFKTTDPLYLTYADMVKDPALSPSDYETRWSRRIVSKKQTRGYALDLEWAVETGPVKLVVYKDGKHHEDKFWMEHSVESMQAAFEYAKSLVNSRSSDGS